MGKLVYLTNVSLDPVIEDEHGSLDWRAPSDERFVHPTNLIRPPGTHLSADFAGIWAAATRKTSR